MSDPKISPELLVKVAQNARLILSEREKKAFLPQLREMLVAFQKLDKLDVSNEKPAFQPVSKPNVFRLDTPVKCLDNQTALQNAVHQKPPYFKGPKAMK